MKSIKTAALLLAISIIVCSFVSCGNSETTNSDTMTLTVSPKELADELTGKYDFGDTFFVYDTDEDAADILLLQYDIEDETVINSLDSYVLSTPGTINSKSLIIFKFKDGTDTETIESVKTKVKDVYLTALAESNAMYDPTQVEIAEKASFVEFDNALVAVAYDINGNSEIIADIKG